MPVHLHFSNLAPSAKKTTLLSVTDGNHVFTHNETMQSYMSHHGSSVGWGYFFSLVIVTDKTKEELEYLLEEIFLEPSNDLVSKYTFLEPEYDTTDYWTIRNTGQIALTFAEFQQYMRLT